MNVRTKTAILIAILALVLVGATLANGNHEQPTISANETSANRWQALGQSYSNRAAQASVSSDVLTPLSADQASVARWQALGQYYIDRAAQIPVSGGEMTSLSADQASVARWQALGVFYTHHPELALGQNR